MIMSGLRSNNSSPWPSIGPFSSRNEQGDDNRNRLNTPMAREPVLTPERQRNVYRDPPVVIERLEDHYEQVNEEANENIDLVIEAINYLQAKNRGRYLENVADRCSKMYNWDEDTIDANIDKAISSGKVIKKLCNSKSYLRVMSTNDASNENEFLIPDPEKLMSPVSDAEYVTMIDFESFRNELMNSFNNSTRYSPLAELDPIKQQTSNIATSPRDTEDNQYLLKYIDSLEKRISSLESQHGFERRLIDDQQITIRRQQRMLEELCKNPIQQVSSSEMKKLLSKPNSAKRNRTSSQPVLKVVPSGSDDSDAKSKSQPTPVLHGYIL